MNSELKEREDILLQIMEIAGKLGVEFAFPTRTLHRHGDCARCLRRRARSGAMNRIACLTRCAAARSGLANPPPRL